MRIGEYLFFSPTVRMANVDLMDRESTIKAFAERVEHYYFEPIGLLNDKKYGFAVGTCCMSLIDR